MKSFAATALCFAGTLLLEGAASSARASEALLEQGIRPTAVRNQAPQQRRNRCSPLPAETPQKRVLLPQQLYCFTVTVAAGEPTQLLLDQPIDLEMRVTGNAAGTRVDSFEIGIETLTFTEPGDYRVEVRAVHAMTGPLPFSIVRWTLDAQKAESWKEAETWATHSKKSKEMKDLEKSLALWTAIGDTSSIARTYLKQGSALQKTDPANALSFFEKALALCRANFDTRCSAEAANNSGTMSRRLADLSGAQRRLKEAAIDWQKLGDKENEGVTLSNLGLTLWQAGDFEQAIGLLNRSESLLRIRDAAGDAKTLNNLGLCYQSLAAYARARGYFESAIKGFIRTQKPTELARARLNLGRNYMLEGNFIRAQQILEIAEKEANTVPDRATRADILRNQAQNFLQQNKPEQARLRLELALEVDRLDGDRRGESSALHYLGIIAQQKGDIATARAFFIQAAHLRHETGLRDDEAESLFKLADLDYQAGNMNDARASAEHALDILESVRSQVPNANLRALYYSRKRQFFELLVELAMVPGNANAAADGLFAVERGRARALMDLLANSASPEQTPNAGRHAQIQRQLDYLANLLSRTQPGKDAELRRRFQELQDEDAALENAIRKSIAGEKLAAPLQSVEELQQKSLPVDSTLLEFHLGRKRSYLWLVDAHHVQVFTLPSAGVIESYARPVVEHFQNILERQRSSEKRAAFRRSLHKLSAALLGQLSEKQLQSRVMLAPDGVLYRVPFAALQLSGATEPLGVEHDLVQVPSASYLLHAARPRPISEFPQTILSIADPVFSASDPRVTGGGRKLRESATNELPRLPFNAEVELIEATVPRGRYRTLRSFAAGRAVLANIHLEDYAILHFSTHALIDDRFPELSRIVLSLVNRAGRPVDGYLHPYQLGQLHLNGSIVVLSACDTALGKQVLGEGMMGFSSSLLYAGASQLVLTLTAVDAEASSSFLTDVYRRFLQGTTSMEHSISLARRTMMHSRRFSDPYYWASFIVIGRPADTLKPGLASM
ncbi:MAG: CHAT domain-containing protein [Acidobacteriia bacterium]|nr:CHAT domain-containing protein [Terriglobia bacterium]